MASLSESAFGRLYNSQSRQFAPYVAGAIAGTFVFLALRVRFARNRARLPPGPKPFPLIGNLLDVPLTEEWLTWRSYVERYGDIVFLSALGNNFLLLGSYQAITDLIEKRVNFNDRAHSTMFIDLMGFNWLLSVMPYGNRWRLGRKLLHAHAHAGAAVDYAPIQAQLAKRFVRDLLASEMSRPTDRLSDVAKAVLPHMVRTNFGITAVRMIYGIDVRDPVAEARFVDVPEAVLRAVTEAGTPGRFLVDFFPWLKYVPSWVPGTYFQRFALETKTLHRQMRDDPMKITQAQLAAGTAPVSLAGRMLESAPDEEQLVKDLAGIVYLAGSDTTVAAVTSFFLAALIYPDMQKKAQAELDRVIGRHRLPEFADKTELPYLDAVMRECLRWLPVLPTGVPHATTEDDEYRGYFIPKGTIVLPFQWGLLQDPNVYPEPLTFAPERHLENLPDGTWKLRADVPDPRLYAFGFGRRVCPGRHIAEQSLFAILATVLHTLDVVRAKDGEGREVVPDVRVNSGLLSHTYPFPYELCMRADARELVDMCVAAAEL